MLTAHRQHPRHWESFKYVYPVLSRRSHGISIGLNVNPDKVCNFDCIYCQVDRTMPEIVKSGDRAQHPPFNAVPAGLLRLNDIALSGDAEPTTLPKFSETIAMIVRVKPPETKLVLI